MPIPFHHEILPSPKTIRIANPLRNNNSEWLAWWYCGIYKNQRRFSQPNVLVAFREINGVNLSESVILRRLPLTELGQVTIGSIWKDGVSRTAVNYSTQDFEVDFCKNGWRITSFNQAFHSGSATPYPMNLYPLPYPADKNMLIEFSLSSGGKLVVPCLEFFSRCYGRSQEIKRILATYPWEGSAQSCLEKLYAPLDEPEEPNIKWKVNLRKRLRKGDVTLLAHAKYDRYTLNAVKSIYAQIESKYHPERKSPLFINVAPWFQGPAELRVRGIWFDNNRSFLALQILGGSDPDGILIERDRENSNKRQGGDTDDNGGEAWANAPEQILVRPPNIVNLTGDTDPDHGTNTAEVLDQDFVLLGIPRAIVDRYGNKITNQTGPRHPGKEPSSYSGGEPHGSGKSIGYASMHARPIIETQGMVMDMWNTMLYIKKTYPDTVKKLEWFTFEDKYQFSDIPHLIALNPFEEDPDENLTTITRNWLYYNVADSTVRGVLVARLHINEIPVHIIEIQRRPRKKKLENGQLKDSEESFKGFITVIADSKQFIPWLQRFLSDIRYVRGIVQKLTPYTPGKSDTFTHSYIEVPCTTVVLRALESVGISL